MKLYFDISDIVQFASRFDRVTGIQRVQMNIVSLLSRKYGADRVRCIFHDSNCGEMRVVDLSQRSPDPEFDADLLLAELGLAPARRRLPSRMRVRNYLRRYKHNKFLRALKQMEIYVIAIFRPSQLASIGLKLRAEPARQLVSVPIKSLSKEDCYVCMGSVWLCAEVSAFAEKHAAGGGRVVQMMYDLIPLSHPEYVLPGDTERFSSWIERSLEYVGRFLAISEWTAKELQSFALLRGATAQIDVVRLAHEYLGYERFAEVSQPDGLMRLRGRPYVLCVGTIETRKNGLLLARAWLRLFDELSGRLPMLVFAGKLGAGGQRLLDLVASNDAFGRFVHIVHTPSDAELAWLYSNCLFTVFPSLLEGWGLPVGEAAWFGKYSVASAASSVPEVCGSLVDYVDPDDLDDLVGSLRKAIVDSEFLQQRERQIHAAKMRLWADVAEDIYEFARN